MATRKALKTCSFSGICSGCPVVGATVGAGTNVDSDEIVAYGDPEYTTVPRQALHNEDLTITFLNETGNFSASDFHVGAVVATTL